MLIKYNFEGTRYSCLYQSYIITIHMHIQFIRINKPLIQTTTKFCKKKKNTTKLVSFLHMPTLNDMLFFVSSYLHCIKQTAIVVHNLRQKFFHVCIIWNSRIHFVRKSYRMFAIKCELSNRNY